MKHTDIKKTLASASAGHILVQEKVDKVLQSLIERNNPFRQNLPRRRGEGQAWIVVRRTAEPSGQWVSDTDEPDTSNSTYERKTFAYKTPFGRGAVTRKLVATGRSYIDIEAEEIDVSVEVVRDTEEYGIIYGSSNANPDQFDGLQALTPSSQEVDLAGEALTLRDVDEAIDLCYGIPDMMIMTKRTRRDLNHLLQAQQRFVDSVEVKGGFRLLSYQDLPIYWSKQLSNDETGIGDTSIYIVDTEHTWMGVLTELTMERLAKTSSQFTKFDVYEDVALVVANEHYNARIKRIAAGS